MIIRNRCAITVPNSKITRLRIYKEDGEWFLDGTDDDGNYSEHFWSYDSHADAIKNVGDFAANL